MRRTRLLARMAMAAALSMTARSRADNTKKAEPKSANVLYPPDSGYWFVEYEPGYTGGFPLGVVPPGYGYPVARDGWGVTPNSLSCSADPVGCPEVTTTNSAQLNLGAYYFSFTVTNDASQGLPQNSGIVSGTVCPTVIPPYSVLLRAEYAQRDTLGRPPTVNKPLFAKCGATVTDFGIETTYGGFFTLESDIIRVPEWGGSPFYLSDVRLFLDGAPGVKFKDIKLEFLGPIGPSRPDGNHGGSLEPYILRPIKADNQPRH